MTEKKNPNSQPSPWPDPHDRKQAEKLNAHERSIQKVEKLAQRGQEK